MLDLEFFRERKRLECLWNFIVAFEIKMNRIARELVD